MRHYEEVRLNLLSELVTKGGIDDEFIKYYFMNSSSRGGVDGRFKK